MKRIVAVILSFVLLFSCMITASAKTSKISDELKEVIENSSKNDIIGIKIDYYTDEVFSMDMPSYPDYDKAKEELKNYYADFYTDMYSKVFNGLYYEEVLKNCGQLVVRVKVANIGKIASFDEVDSIDYCSQIEQKYLLYATPQIGYYSFEKTYEHKDENGEIDWILLKADTGNAMCALCGMDLGDVVVHSPNIYSYFTYNYGVYDVKEDKIYDLKDLRKTPYKYNELGATLVDLGVANPFGDADKDGKVTIFDATYISRYLVDLEKLSYREHYNVVVRYDEHEENRSGYVSDIDRDGKITIMDATTIQKKLAHAK
ncbi:MAG: dockerin type I repeat-containing protein [Ruminococcus sp.]|nr:dockerin type I repeat-containing protein [Ruminococcus sp.]